MCVVFVSYSGHFGSSSFKNKWNVVTTQLLSIYNIMVKDTSSLPGLHFSYRDIKLQSELIKLIITDYLVRPL